MRVRARASSDKSVRVRARADKGVKSVESIARVGTVDRRVSEAVSEASH